MIRNTCNPPIAVTLPGAIVVSGCASTDYSEDLRAFEYTEKIQNEIAQPILMKELGGLIGYYDPAHPTIGRKCNEIRLTFSFDSRKLAKNEEVLDPPYVIIILNPRTLALRNITALPSYVIGPDRCA